MSEDQQARYTVRGLMRIRDEWPWAGVSFVWFFRRPDDHDKAQQYYYFRLVEPDFTTLPVYDAISKAAPALNVLRRGWQTPASFAVTRGGQWQESAPAAGQALPSLHAAPPGAELSFSFAGSDLTLGASGPARL